ncbi:MAG: hypothetical protein JSW61_09715 [Candidatus Thorarchaeota archaeon]|nr:MAG: hypothetical protein JSW61_09715 [Candidatus Thorarchaeota archaeon]
MADNLELMVKYLVHLQFYSEEEGALYSRDKKHKLTVPGIAQVIDGFVRDLTKPILLVQSKEYRSYLEAIALKLPIDVDDIEREFQDSLSELPADQLTDELAANFLIGPIRSSLQSREFESCIEQVRSDAEERLQGVDAATTIKARLYDLYSKNDGTVSLLYNLSLLRLLASIYGNRSIFTEIDLLVKSHCDELVDKLSS